MNASSETVNLHPPREQLQKFVAGELSAGLSVAVSAHIEYCVACRQASDELESSLAADWNDFPVADAANDYGSLLDRIVSQPQATEMPMPVELTAEIVVDNRSVPVPRVLAKIAGSGLAWKHYPGGVSQAKVALDDSTKCEFIYMAPGSKAPAHSHRGNEVMLVLDGSFTDELGEYNPADFVMRDPSHSHQPQTKDGCLCFSVLDSPLIFKDGMLRFLNPFNRIMFNKMAWFR